MVTGKADLKWLKAAQSFFKFQPANRTVFNELHLIQIALTVYNSKCLSGES